MKHIDLKNTTLESTSKQCPICESTLQKIIPKTEHDDFDAFYLCDNCNFIGSSDISQVQTALTMLKANSIQLVDFKTDVVRGYVPLTVEFISNCFNINATDWKWDFGDGETGDGETITHEYTTPGTYNVNLDVFEERVGRTNRTKNSAVIVENFTQPKSSFHATQTHGYDSLLTQFIATPEGSEIIGYEWDFGDGTPHSTLKDPFHEYTSIGYYDVSLTVQNINGTTDTTSMVEFISVEYAPPVADFTADPIDWFEPSTVDFRYTGGSDVFNYYWTFGDGSISTDSNPTHTYDTTGLYDVTLNVNNPSGEDTRIRNGYINIRPYAGSPVADFEITPIADITELPQRIQLTDISTVSGAVEWAWIFSNGVVSDEQNPIVEFNEYGTYTFTMQITDSHGATDNVSKSITIDIIPASAQYSYTSIPGNNTIEFINESTGDFLYYQWVFGDGNTSTEENPVHAYSIPGRYTVSLTVSNSKGFNTITQDIVVG